MDILKGKVARLLAHHKVLDKNWRWLWQEKVQK
jgi:hypothetical protein